MTRDAKYDILFEPLRIGPKTMRNRFYQTPHCTGFGSDRPGAQAQFRAMKAEGGWAVVNTEWCSIHPESDQAPAIDARLWDEDDVRNLGLMCDEVHRHGALAGVELGFNGPHGTNYESRIPTRGVSQIPSDAFHWHSCYSMSRDEVRELQRFYVAAAVRAQRAGFDIVNIMGAEAAGIPQQFLMPYFNKRTDEYGGSFENRARFWLELLEMVREAVGQTCAITTRFCIDTLQEGDQGIRVGEEGIGFIQLADHLVDFWDLQVGGATRAEWGDDAGPSRFFPENFQRAWLQQVRPYTAKPIVGVGRFTNPDTMVDAIRSGQLDIIGAARPSIADPFLPRKVEEGRLDEIRECIGCNICVSRYEQKTQIICTQNPTSGEEYRRGWHPERFAPAANAKNDVLVVGAGPAGMECAIVLGKRGMRRVHLVDAAEEMGGCVRWIAKLPGLGEWARVVNYRKIQVAKLKNVEFIPRKRLSVQDILDYGAEYVVVATGSSWAGDGLNAFSHEPIEGADAAMPHVLSPEQVMVEGKALGERVLVYDCDGYYMGCSLAEKLAREGMRVTLVSPLAEIGAYMFHTLEGIRMHRLLHELGVDLVPSHQVRRIGEAEVEGHPVHARKVVRWAIDSVVLVTQRLSDDQVYRGLMAAAPEELEDAGIAGVFRIGDCVVPRLIADAVFDGHRLGREFDGVDPSAALPFIRERRALGVGDGPREVAAAAASIGAGAP